MHSVSKYPEVLCGDSEHTSLVLMALALALLIVIPFTAWVVHGSWTVGRRCHDKLEAEQLTRFNFMLLRFRPDKWWFSNVCYTRQLLLAFTPTLPDTQPHLQTIYMLMVLLLYVILLSYYWPWRSTMVNLVDLIVAVLVMMLVMVAAAFLTVHTEYEVFYAGFVFVIIANMIFAVLVLFIGCGVRLLKGHSPRGPTHRDEAMRAMETRVSAELEIMSNIGSPCDRFRRSDARAARVRRERRLAQSGIGSTSSMHSACLPGRIGVSNELCESVTNHLVELTRHLGVEDFQHARQAILASANQLYALTFTESHWLKLRASSWQCKHCSAWNDDVDDMCVVCLNEPQRHHSIDDDITVPAAAMQKVSL
eukprot:gnl/TRDRNA2_/TRDRNA2_150155_c4_seq1.p1 gnl/TRDRNA2_/TRDRNA2_150155_c4~~gnl/TRDRNA2_/TRDRNA2_150155_c4_seq1.p1  ORF type:complete len:365 (+),score=25.23 gnl/TRDRNA2_/TRDRNA2_150155_c4_seq1:3-1097(+)